MPEFQEHSPSLNMFQFTTTHITSSTRERYSVPRARMRAGQRETITSSLEQSIIYVVQIICFASAKMTCNRYPLCLGLWIWFMLIIWLPCKYIWPAIRGGSDIVTQSFLKAGSGLLPHQEGRDPKQEKDSKSCWWLDDGGGPHGMGSWWLLVVESSHWMQIDMKPIGTVVLKSQETGQKTWVILIMDTFLVPKRKLSQANSLILALQDPELRTK